MQTGVRQATVRAMFERLIDYAGLFPPAALSMAHAVSEYTAARRGEHAWMLGRFVVQASRFAELREHTAPQERVEVSVILDGNAEDPVLLAALRDTPDVVVGALEVAIGSRTVAELVAARQRYAAHDIPMYVEVAREELSQLRLQTLLPQLQAAALGAKVRCGGLTADAFPTPDELALFIHTATRCGLTFKATAGLHHPVRHWNDAANVTMHGFLNLLAASALARTGSSVAVLANVLSCTQPSAFEVDEAGLRFESLRVDPRSLTQTRRHGFIAYGSCSFREPIDDLSALGLL